MRTFKEAFDASHLLDHLGKLGVLGQQLLDISGDNSRPPSHPLDPVRLLTEQLGPIFTVQLWRVQTGKPVRLARYKYAQIYDKESENVQISRTARRTGYFLVD